MCLIYWVYVSIMKFIKETIRSLFLFLSHTEKRVHIGCTYLNCQRNLLIYSFYALIKLALEKFEIKENSKNGPFKCCGSGCYDEVKRRYLQKSIFFFKSVF